MTETQDATNDTERWGMLAKFVENMISDSIPAHETYLKIPGVPAAIAEGSNAVVAATLGSSINTLRTVLSRMRQIGGTETVLGDPEARTLREAASILKTRFGPITVANELKALEAAAVRIEMMHGH